MNKVKYNNIQIESGVLMQLRQRYLKQIPYMHLLKKMIKDLSGMVKYLYIKVMIG